MRIVSVLTVVSVLLAGSTGCRHAQEGSIEASITIAGRERTYLYRIPLNRPADAKSPMVIALHGRLATGVKMERVSGMSPIADREGFVVVYPDGYSRSWNDARGKSPAASKSVDDIAFLRALIDRMVAEHAVDPRRVYVAGASNGGMMAFRAACELSDKIAAVGSVIGLMPFAGSEVCSPAHPVPIMIIVGTDDPIVPYGGGDINGIVLSADATREKWATLNGCGPAGTPEIIDRVADGTRVRRTIHAGCDQNSEVVLDAIEGAGHTWPNGPQYLPELFVGKVSRDMDASEELFRFFRSRALPEASPPSPKK